MFYDVLRIDQSFVSSDCITITGLNKEKPHLTSLPMLREVKPGPCGRRGQTRQSPACDFVLFGQKLGREATGRRFVSRMLNMCRSEGLGSV